MIRFFQRFGCCISSNDVMSAEDRGTFVKGQERPDLSLPSKSQKVEQTLHDVDHSSTSANARTMTINQRSANIQDTERIVSEFHSNQSTSRVAMFEKAHNFRIENAPITNIGLNINNINRHGNYEMLEKFVSFSALHDSSAQDPDRCCHPGTRETVLDQMRNWVEDPSRPERILWLHGPAGVGKSAIAQTISYSYDQDKVGATFFFFRSDVMRNDGNRLFPTLAWQLALSVPVVKDPIALSLEKHPDVPRKAIEVQFDQLIAQPFLAISSGESVVWGSTRVIIIDGLDECSDVKLQRRILKTIGNAVADSCFPLRFIISSRPEAHIEDFFAQFEHPTLQIDLAKVEDALRDIRTYLISEFTRIAVEQQLDPKTWPGQDLIDTLVFNSSGQFVYASTIIKYVGDEYESAVVRLNVILGLRSWAGRSPFADLDGLYIEILQRQPDQDFLREFLQVLVARSMLAGIEDEYLYEDDAILLGVDEKQLHRKLRGMHSVIKFEPVIDVHHKSFLDFLDDPSRSGKNYVSKDVANRRYIQRIVELLVDVASRAMERPESHEGDHFRPGFAAVIKQFPFPIELPSDGLEEIFGPFLTIQENLLQLPDMSIPWKPRACGECWTFYMIDDLFLHLAWIRATTQIQELKYVEVRPLTATEEKQSIPQLDLDTCLSLLFAKLRNVELSLNVNTIGIVRALVYFDPIETAMKIRTIADAQNLVELIFSLNKNGCFRSWFGASSHNATRVALAIYGRIPLLPRSLFLNNTDFDGDKSTYQGKVVITFPRSCTVQEQFFDAFVWGSLSHRNMGPFLGIRSFESSMMEVLANPENSTLAEWRQSTNPSVLKVQQIMLELAKASQYVHSLGLWLRHNFSETTVYLDVDNHAKVKCAGFCSKDLCEGQFEYDRSRSILEHNTLLFCKTFSRVLFGEVVTSETRPTEPEIPDNLWQLIQRCCAKNPEERPTMDQIVQEMETWIPPTS